MRRYSKDYTPLTLQLLRPYSGHSSNTITESFRLRKEPLLHCASQQPYAWEPKLKVCNIHIKKMTRINGQSLRNFMAFIRRRLCLELLMATLIAVRGHRGRYYQKPLPIEEQDLNLVEEANTDDV